MTTFEETEDIITYRIDNYPRLERDYAKLKQEASVNARLLESALKQNATLEGTLKKAGFMIGQDPNPSYPNFEVCVKDQINSKGKSPEDAKAFCQKLSDNSNNNNNSDNSNKEGKIKEASRKNIPAWVQNRNDLFDRGGEPNHIATYDL